MQSGLAPSAYSGKPLTAKPGLKDGTVAARVRLAAALEPLASPVRFAAVDRPSHWSALADAPRRYDCIRAFTRKHAEVERHLDDLQAAIVSDGMIWMSWPKRASKVATDGTGDAIRTEALKLGPVDVKLAALDATWSGLKLVIRKERRK
jgi:hypothetical protein